MLPTFKQSILVLSFLRKVIAKKRAKKLVKRLVIEIITHWSLEIHDASYVHTKRLKVCRTTDLLVVFKTKDNILLTFFHSSRKYWIHNVWWLRLKKESDKEREKIRMTGIDLSRLSWNFFDHAFVKEKNWENTTCKFNFKAEKLIPVRWVLDQ